MKKLSLMFALVVSFVAVAGGCGGSSKKAAPMPSPTVEPSPSPETPTTPETPETPETPTTPETPEPPVG
jgi:hypothetical protein